MTMVYLALLFGISFAVHVASWVGSVWLGTRWAGVSTTWSRIIGLAVIWFSARYAFMMARLLVAVRGTPTLIIATIVVDLVAMVVITLWLFRREFQTPWGRTFRIWVASWLAVVPSFLLAWFIKANLAEAFSVPTNAMAPTILGHHHEVHCPKCDGKAYQGVYPYPQPSVNNICEQFHTFESTTAETKVESGDRVLVAKWITPKRWDVIAFRNPNDTSQNYVKRLVGLPGETVCIAGGRITINGAEVKRPEALANLQYEDTMFEKPVWGTDPITLGANEYYVLGDFSKQSLDSRLWQGGDGTRPPYAVPGENLIGVVAFTYWPLDRFRTFR